MSKSKFCGKFDNAGNSKFLDINCFDAVESLTDRISPGLHSSTSQILFKVEYLIPFTFPFLILDKLMTFPQINQDLFRVLQKAK